MSRSACSQPTRRINWQEISANVVGLEGLEAELAEIDENLMRNDLIALEHAEHTIRRKVVYEQMHPEAKQGASGGWHNNKGEKLENDNLSFSRDTSQKTGVSVKTVERDIQIGSIPQDIRDSIRNTDIADSKTQLLALAQMDHDMQRQTIKHIESGKRVSVTQEAPKPNRTQFTGENEWYTPMQYIELARAAMRDDRFTLYCGNFWRVV